MWGFGLESIIIVATSNFISALYLWSPFWRVILFLSFLAFVLHATSLPKLPVLFQELNQTLIFTEMKNQEQREEPTLA